MPVTALVTAWRAARRAPCAWAGRTLASTARAWRRCGRTCSCRRRACRWAPADARSAESCRSAWMASALLCPRGGIVYSFMQCTRS